MQICAKIGGEPWAIDKIPFSDKPTMIVGLDVYNKGTKSFIGCCATFNHTFTKYLSIVKSEIRGTDLSEKVNQCISEAIQHVIILI
jgi:aubergine-like protein